MRIFFKSPTPALQNPHVLLIFDKVRNPLRLPRETTSERPKVHMRSQRDGKLHAVVARSTFPSQNVQSTPVSDHFWKLRCRKSARRCGAKDASKSKCTKRTIIGPLLEVDMSKKVDAVVARSTFPSQNVKDTTNHWKHTVFRDFPTFSRTWILILLRLSLF